MEEYQPRIGKNVIETLTSGMYENVHFIYREYVQNAADQIDEAVELGILGRKSDGIIDIIIDKDHKTIIIKDNATGIKSGNVLQFLGDVANSQKNRDIRKGFRGIGRLGGLGYCEKLIFETTYKGEKIKSVITLNAKELKRIIEDRTDIRDASAVISVITTLEKIETDLNEHYFHVKLVNVTNEELLDESKVKNYLSIVAPIPFDENFPFRDKIRDFFNKNNVKIEEYDVHLNLNDKKLYKPYKTNILDKNNEILSNILDVNFFDVRGIENEIIAIGWYGVSNLLNFQIPDNNIERGIRLRKDNIGIGSEITLSRFFGQSRQNLNYIGEVHAISNSFIPNARRDYFNDNKTTQVFEKNLRTFFSKLGYLTQTSSELHNRRRDIEVYKKRLEDFNNELINAKLTDREERHLRNDLDELKKKVFNSTKKIITIHKRSLSDENMKTLYDNIIKPNDLNIEFHDDTIIKKNNYPLLLSKLNESEKRIVLEIFSILENNLSLEDSEMIKKKIADRYN